MVVMGHAGLKKFTLTNPTEVEVPLIIDLRKQEYSIEKRIGIECIELKLLSKDAFLEPYKEKVVHEES